MLDRFSAAPHFNFGATKARADETNRHTSGFVMMVSEIPANGGKEGGVPWIAWRGKDGDVVRARPCIAACEREIEGLQAMMGGKLTMAL